MPVPDFLLSESAAGYSLFQVTESEEIGVRSKEFLETLLDLYAFSRLVKLVAFGPFKSAANALENINDISEGQVNDHLKTFLEMNLPKPSKSHKTVLGVSDPKLAGAIKDALGKGYDFDTGDVTQDLLRGLRTHASKMLKDLQPGDLERAQLGLGHSYSRAKVKFNVNKSDNMIIQTIALLDQLDKDINTFAMRVREWYSWHFPELIRHVSENYKYAQLALLIKDKSKLTEASLSQILEIVGDDEGLANSIIESAKMSMGQDISEMDMENVVTFAEKVTKLADFRRELHAYLVEKMNIVAPNLAALIGEMVGARLIAHAGSLTNLSKYPASTVQILGAEKALFRALKTKGNTPKYGLIYHSSFIGRAAARNKGRISRTVANKCTIAARIDCFSDSPTTVFGEALRKQVEERLAFYDTGVAPSKNADAMRDALAKYGENAEEGMMDVESEAEDESDDEEVNTPKKAKSKEKDKKDKKDKKSKKEKKDKKEKKKKAALVEAETVQLDGDSKREEKKKRKREDDEVTSTKKSKKSKKEKKEKKEKKAGKV